MPEYLTIEAVCTKGCILLCVCARMRACVKGKPHKYSMKIVQLCEVKNSYLWKLEVYYGAHTCYRSRT